MELQDYLKRGVLSKLDVAFSRDQAQKVYVQDKLRLKAEEIWTWLQQGAYLYICGDGNKMAKDVHQALLDIVQQQAGLNAEEAEQYFDDLTSSQTLSEGCLLMTKPINPDLQVQGQLSDNERLKKTVIYYVALSPKI